MTNHTREILLTGIERFCIVLLLAALSGCGVETATTAATAVKIKAKEVEEAKKTEEQTRQKLDQTMQQAAEQRARDASKQ